MNRVERHSRHRVGRRRRQRNWRRESTVSADATWPEQGRRQVPLLSKTRSPAALLRRAGVGGVLRHRPRARRVGDRLVGAVRRAARRRTRSTARPARGGRARSPTRSGSRSTSARRRSSARWPSIGRARTPPPTTCRSPTTARRGRRRWRPSTPAAPAGRRRRCPAARAAAGSACTARRAARSTATRSTRSRSTAPSRRRRHRRRPPRRRRARRSRRRCRTPSSSATARAAA